MAFPTEYQWMLIKRVGDAWDEIAAGKTRDYNEYLEETKRRKKERLRAFVETVVDAYKANTPVSQITMSGASRPTILKYAGDAMEEVRAGKR